MSIKNEQLAKKLEKAGFSNKESIIYVAVLELGGASPSRIAEYSGLKRGITYNILATLSVRGLINEIEKEKKLFCQIDRPEKIFRYAKNRAEQASDDLEIIKEVIPEIDGLFGILKNRPRVKYYEGVDGLHSVYADMLNIDKPYEMLLFSKADEFGTFLPKEFILDIMKKKIEHGITTRALFPNTKENINFNETYYKNIPDKFLPKCKYIDADKFPLIGEIVIYGDSKIAITNLAKGQLMAVIMEDPALHNMMRTIFELSWNSSLVK
jgi:hypothetical protein